MEKLRLYAKTVPITFESWVISYIGIVLVRTLLEQYPSFQVGHFVLIDLPTIFHYIASYLAITVTLMTILLFFGKTSMQEVSVIAIFGSFIIWIAPIIDLIWGGIGGHLISYFFIPGQELALRFVTFFGGHITSGITLGIQIETLLGIIFCYLYIYSATKNIYRSLTGAFAFYCLIFFIFSIPSLIALFLPDQGDQFIAILKSIDASSLVQNNIHPNFNASNIGLIDLAFNKLMASVNVLLALVMSLFFFYLGMREKFLAVMKNSRPERIFHFFLLFIFGASLSIFFTTFLKSWINIQSFLLALIALTGAWVYSVCQNDMYDETIDSVSNKDRPLIGKELTKSDMDVISKVFLFITFLSAYTLGHYILFFISLFLFVYYIYSNPPLRLKRFVILNSFLVSLACLSVIMAGFFLLNPDKNILAFPPGLGLAIIIFFSAVTNIRDIKDVEGDRADGIKTLPVLLGTKKAKMLIAATICFFFLLIPWYFHVSFLLIPSIIASLLSWYFITEKNYKEWKGFAVYMLYLILIIGTFILK